MGAKTKGGGFRTANQAEVAENVQPSLTAQQVEQLLKLLPQTSSNNSNSSVGHSEETDEEIDFGFAGTTVCFHAEQEPVDWVLDTGATDHMTSLSSCLSRVNSSGLNCCIKLSNGGQVPITHVGDVKLCNDLTLQKTLVVPEFKYNLLSISKLCKDSNCIAIFHNNICLL